MKRQSLLIAISILLLTACGSPTVQQTANPPTSLLASQIAPIATQAAPTAILQPAKTQEPAFLPSPTQQLASGSAQLIIFSQKEANLTGNPAWDNNFFSIVLYDYANKTGMLLLQSDGTTTAYTSNSISSDGKYLYLSKHSLLQTSSGQAWNSNIYRMDLSIRELTRISVTPSFPADQQADDFLIETYADVSNDGRYLVFNSNRADLSATDSLIYLMDLQDSSIKLVPNTPEKPIRAKFSPDGLTLALTGWDGSDWEIYTIGVDGNGLSQMTDNSYSDRYPDWSPDGKSLVYHSTRDGNVDLYILAAGQETRITDNPAMDFTANWSPDGKMILFASDRNGNQGAFARNVATGEVVEIYFSPGVDAGFLLWVP
jgi:Tol biopolymer transport system component